jgi:type I restriction enzyme S subunit
MTQPLVLHAAEETLEAVHTRRHAAYPAYDPSGVEWLGDVPEHWVVKRLKRSVLSRKGGVWGEEPDDENMGVICVRVADFNRKSLRVRIENPTLRSISENELKGRILEKGDLLLEKSGGGEKQLVGSVMLFDHDVRAVNSNFVARMTPAPNYDSRYLVYLHSWLYSARINFRSIKQTTGIQNLDSDAYLSEKVAFPPLEEQQAIACFLDGQTRKIDELIEAKLSLLDLLKEKRQAVITHAVTRGLDPAAKLKPSGVEWLGDVPEHWDVKSLKYIAGVQFSNVDKHTLEGEVSVRLCNYTDVYYNERIVADLPFMEATATENEIAKFRLEPGDVIVTKDSEDSSDIAVPALVVHEFTDVLCGYHLAQIRPDPNYAIGSYLSRAFASSGIMNQFHVAATGVTRYGLPKDALRDAMFPVPPPEEQRKIARFLDEETQKMDDLESVVREAIETLALLRAGIISAAVTGKIDVREEGV